MNCLGALTVAVQHTPNLYLLSKVSEKARSRSRTQKQNTARSRSRKLEDLWIEYGYVVSAKQHKFWIALIWCNTL